MHDTFLLKKISESLEQFCRDKEIGILTKVEITVNPDSHVTQESLMEELKNSMADFIGKDLKLKVHIKNIQELTAYINSIEGR
ncbi:hypothetical protein [Clostridium grantii]|uniref:Hydrogenase nickel incorporation protein HypA/HybF n=1 Tax=Clostridium grantii DSM 8605 TaxID=1121316 RepID=A0A1M5VNY8_9CLOT|nr:hypothetical protein [Clostridium grantii]SHH76959.1 hypothetical protein SAMN02745207_02401 [Clostridium grantii DSM 8605]